MDRIDEWAMRRMCENLGLECFYDAASVEYVFRKKLDSKNVADQLEYCFGEDAKKLHVSAYYLRGMDSISLYKFLQEVFAP